MIEQHAVIETKKNYHFPRYVKKTKIVLPKLHIEKYYKINVTALGYFQRNVSSRNFFFFVSSRNDHQLYFFKSNNNNIVRYSNHEMKFY